MAVLHQQLRVRLAAVPFGRALAVLGLAVAAFAVLGALEASGAPLGAFDVDSEGTPPAVFSALIDALAGLLGVLLWAQLGQRRWLALGLFLAFMGADDLLRIHEHLQILTGIDWLYLYLPLIAAGGMMWLLVLATLRRTAAALLVLGAGAWCSAWVLEKFAWDDGGHVSNYAYYAVTEEALEMAGSGCFLLALLLALTRTRTASPAADGCGSAAEGSWAIPVVNRASGVEPVGMSADPTLLPSGEWTIDPDASAVRFSVRHAGVARTRGAFRIAEAEASSDPAVGLRVAASIDAGSVDTSEPVRDARLRDEFFDVEHHPQIRFAARIPAEASHRITGELTIRGATRPIELDAVAEPAGDGAVRIRARGRLSRRAFGLEWSALVDGGRLLVGDRVDVEADVVARAA